SHQAWRETRRREKLIKLNPALIGFVTLVTMLTFFDYLYYKVCEFYARNKEGEPGVTALLIIALMHGFNVLSLIFMINVATHTKIGSSKLSWIILIALLLLLNGIRYNKYNYSVLKAKWAAEEEKTRKRREN